MFKPASDGYKLYFLTGYKLILKIMRNLI